MKLLKSKPLVTALALALVLAVSMGGTLAFLQDVSAEKVNTFQKQEIRITLNDISAGTYEITPGQTWSKQATATVDATLDAWVFLREEDNTDALVTYEIDREIWKELGTEYPGIWYTETTPGTKDFDILSGDRISIAPSVKMADVNAARDELTLTFTAYVIQKPKSGSLNADGSIADGAEYFTPETAWAEILNPTVPSPAPSPSPSPAQP